MQDKYILLKHLQAPLVDEGRLHRQESFFSPGIADPHGNAENLGGYMALHQQTLGICLVGG